MWGYRFGSGKKSACIVGAIRGNEVQQLYVCSQLVKKLEELERLGAIVSDNEILVVPSVNHHSMNIGKRFWTVDNTDINRMFPGYSLGETTQRIAAGVFDQVKEYSYGIQFASFYLPGDFIPHVRMMETGYHNHSGYIASIISEDELTSVKTTAAGIYRRNKQPGEEVKMGDELAEIIHPYEGGVISRVLSPTDGIIFFAHKKPLVTESEIVYKIIRRMHE